MNQAQALANIATRRRSAGFCALSSVIQQHLERESHAHTRNHAGLPRGRRRISSNMVIVVLFALLVALIPIVPRLEAAPREQPELIALAQQQPKATIGVIVAHSTCIRRVLC